MSPRIVLAVAGLAALVLPLPAATPLGVVLSVTGLVALGYSVARPGSGAAAVLIAAAALAWLDTPPGHQHLERLAGLALAVAIVHSSAALAAVVPARGRIPVTLLLRWAGWTAAATALGAGALAGASLVPTAGATPAVTAAAVLATAVVAVVLIVRVVRPAGRLDEQEPAGKFR